MMLEDRFVFETLGMTGQNMGTNPTYGRKINERDIDIEGI